MSIETFLVDLDGVVVHRAGYFSELAKELYPGANHETIKEFFVGGRYAQTTRGEESLEEALGDVLESWDIDKTVPEVLQDWFGAENNVDQVVLTAVQALRKQGIQCVIATDHSDYRKQDVWHELGMKAYFDDIVSSSDFGVTKEESAFYHKAMEKFQITDPGKLAFTDDDPENVAVATAIGVKAAVFTDVSDLQRITEL